MAQKVNVVLVDDVDGSEASETISFALDGKAYEIDLNDKNAAKLRDSLASWVGHARSAGRVGSGRGARRSAASGDREETQKMRDWGRKNGFKVSERGRLSAELVAAYKAAH